MVGRPGCEKILAKKNVVKCLTNTPFSQFEDIDFYENIDYIHICTFISIVIQLNAQLMHTEFNRDFSTVVP